MANDLRVGIVADASQLGTTMDSAAVKVESFADRAAVAMERYNAAAAKGTTVQEALGASFDKATAAGKSTTEAMEAAVAAYESLNTVSGEVVVSQERVAAAVTSVGISSRQAATAGIGILEGRMMSGTRAAGAFLANTLGLGPALQAAFPVIGALALGMVLVDITKGIVHFGEEAEDLADELNTDWLTGAIGQMDGLGDAVKQADKEVEQLNKSLDDTHKRSQEAAVERIRLVDGPAAGYRAEATNDKTQELANEKALTILMQEQARLKQASKPGQRPDLSPGAEYEEQLKSAKDLEVVNKQIADYQATDNMLLAEAANLELQAQQVKPKKMKPSEGFAEWLEGEKAYEAQSKQITEAITAAWVKAQVDQEELDRKAAESVKAKTEDFKKAHEEQMRMLEEETSRAVRSASAEEEEANRIIEARLKMGQISPRTAESERLDVSHATEDQQVMALQAQQSQFHPEQGADQAAKYQAIQDQITAIQQRAANQREQITQQETQREYQVFSQVFQQMAGAVNGFADYFLTHQHQMGRAFQQMGDQMALALVNDLLKMGEKWVEHEAFVTLQHLLGITQRQVADTTSATTAKTIQSTLDVAMVTSYAAVAAAGAAASAALLGPAAAAAAAAATFAATSAYTAPAAFERGTDYVPRTGMAMLHEGERVSSRPENEAISRALQGGKGGQGGDNHFHYAPNISGIDGASVAGMARQHGNAFLRQAGRQMRLSGRSQG
jgi:hypothetical protein